MSKTYDFLKKAGTFYLATVEDKQPRVRPFGAVCEFEGKLYIITSKQKSVYAQIQANPKVEMCGIVDGQWIRIAGELVEDDRREARVAMLEENPSLTRMYSVDDGIMSVLYFQNATSTFASFTAEPTTETL